MAEALYRDRRQEQFATEPTKRVRELIEQVDGKWSLGVFPNIQTDYRAGSSIGNMRVCITTYPDEGTKIILWSEDGLTEEQLKEIVHRGFNVGMPI